MIIMPKVIRTASVDLKKQQGELVKAHAILSLMNRIPGMSGGGGGGGCFNLFPIVDNQPRKSS